LPVDVPSRDLEEEIMKSLVSLAVALAIAVALPVKASTAPVTVEFQVEIAQVYDYPTGTYQAIEPVIGTVSVTFDTTPRSFDDYGQTTITRFGDVLGAVWKSPITRHIPEDPYTGAYGPFYNSYEFPNVSDYTSVFIEEGAAQANTYASGAETRYYHIEARAQRRSQPRNGDGSSDYAFTRAGLIKFYKSFKRSGEPVHFSESYAVYTIVDGKPVYSDGKLWETYSAKVKKVIDHGKAG
jgi:hypothetical protein